MRGTDSLGVFTVKDGLRDCYHCHEKTQLTIRYVGITSITDHMKRADLPSILRPMTHEGTYRLGMTCGCYAKLHRQIVHIQANTKG